MDCVKRFKEIYKKDPAGHAFCPYRVCPIGAHSDHQFGKITGLTLDRGVHIAYSVKLNGVVELMSEQFEKRAQWHVKSVPPTPDGDWADYLRGATIALSKRCTLINGIAGVVEGTLPIGGLSSSAAVIIAFLSALCHANSITLPDSELILIALEAENEYVGVSCGKLDQSCEVYSKKDHLLYLDTLDDSYELIPVSGEMPDYKIIIFFSGVERTLAATKFNMRVDECRSAAYALMAYAGMDYGKFKDANLRYVPRDVFEQHRSKLPYNWEKRALHWYDEYERVQRGAEAWRRGDIVEFGKLSFESGRSSVENWETGSDELKAIYEIMTRTEGIYGGRFSGAGFKGCCMAIVNPELIDSIIDKVSTEYLSQFPHLKGKFEAFVCNSADGASFSNFTYNGDSN